MRRLGVPNAVESLGTQVTCGTLPLLGHQNHYHPLEGFVTTLIIIEKKIDNITEISSILRSRFGDAYAVVHGSSIGCGRFL